MATDLLELSESILSGRTSIESRHPVAMMGVTELHELAVVRLPEGHTAEEAIASALYCVWRHPDDFLACVLEAVATRRLKKLIVASSMSIYGEGAYVDAEGRPVTLRAMGRRRLR